MDSKPFMEEVRRLNQRMRYVDMEAGCGRVRSSAWFNNVANGYRVNPPPPEILPKIAGLFGVPTARVREMVAEQWYGVRLEEVTARVRALAHAIDSLDEEDASLVEQLLTRLSRPGGSTTSADA